MKKLVVSVLGKDQPGIVASVSNILYAHDCNIEDVTQTILQSEFAAILLVNCSESCVPGLAKELQQKLDSLGLSVFIRPATAAAAIPSAPPEPLVVTTSGPDCSGQVARVAAVIRDFNANITELKAVSRKEPGSSEFIMIFEIAFPLGADFIAFRDRLRDVCSGIGLRYSVQHRDIFEAINRV